MNNALLLQLLQTLYTDIVLKKVDFRKRDNQNVMITTSWHGMTVVVGPNEGSIGVSILGPAGSLSVLASQLPAQTADELRRVWVEIDPTLMSLSDVLTLAKS